MRFSVDVPDDIFQAVRDDNNIGRKSLVEKFGIAEWKARVFLDAIRHGQRVHVEQPKFGVESGQTLKALLLPDIHWPYHDQRALDAAIEYGIKSGCSIFVIQGDGFDCYAISRFRKDPLRLPYPKERKLTIELFEAFTQSIESFRRVFLCGNHEERLQSYVFDNAPAFADLKALTIPSLYNLDELGWEFVSNKELKRAGCMPFRLGKCFVFHGHEIGMSGGARNFARLHYLKDPVNQINAHHHQEDSAKFTKSSGEMDGSWTIGCLCQLAPDYAPFNQWGHGCATVEWDNAGDFRVTQRPIIQGVVH